LDAQVIEAVPEAGAEGTMAERERRDIPAWIGAMRRWRAGETAIAHGYVPYIPPGAE